jgi:hypothetical protein
MAEGDICAHCGERLARYWSLTILSSVTLRVTPICGPCHDAEVAADSSADSQPTEDVEPMPADIEAKVLALGPIDWAVLAPCLVQLESAPEMPVHELMFVAHSVRRIAAHHDQSLPADVAAFVSRHAPPDDVRWLPRE